MSETYITLSGDVARIILLEIASAQNGYNDAWAWWAYDADDTKSYGYGFGTAKKEQMVDVDGQIELIISILPDAHDTPAYFRVRGELNSYGRNKWDAVVTEVKPTSRVVRIYE